MNIFKEMSLRWHIVTSVCYLAVYFWMFASGYLEKHADFVLQQSLAWMAGGMIASVAVRLRHPWDQDQRHQ